MRTGGRAGNIDYFAIGGSGDVEIQRPFGRIICTRRTMAFQTIGGSRFSVRGFTTAPAAGFPFRRRSAASFTLFQRRSATGFSPFRRRSTVGFPPFRRRSTVGFPPFRRRSAASIPFRRQSTAGFPPFRRWGAARQPSAPSPSAFFRFRRQVLSGSVHDDVVAAPR